MVHFRVTEEEYTELLHVARAKELELSEYVRMVLFRKKRA